MNRWIPVSGRSLKNGWKYAQFMRNHMNCQKMYLYKWNIHSFMIPMVKKKFQKFWSWAHQGVLGPGPEKINYSWEQLIFSIFFNFCNWTRKRIEMDLLSKFQLIWARNKESTLVLVLFCKFPVLQNMRHWLCNCSETVALQKEQLWIYVPPMDT